MSYLTNPYRYVSGGVPMDTDLTNYSDFSISTTTETNDTATRLNQGSYTSSWAYQSQSITASKYLEYYVNDSLVYTSTRFNSGTYYPAIQSDMHSEGVAWQLSSYASDHATWKLVGYTGLQTSSIVGLNDSTTKVAWFDNTAFFFIGTGSPMDLQIYEYDGGAQLEWARSPQSLVSIGDTLKIVIN